MTEKGPNTLIKSLGLYSHRTIGNGRFTSLKSYETSIFKQIRKVFNPMAINVQGISLTHEKMQFFHYSVLGVIYALIDALGHCSVILQPWNFCKVEFTDICSACETRRKITKILQPFGFSLELESLKSVKYSCCYEFSKVGTFFWFTRYKNNLQNISCQYINKTNYSCTLNMYLKTVDLSESYLMTSSGQPIHMNARSFSFPRVDRLRVFTCFSLVKALSQQIFVNEGVKVFLG